MQSPDTTDAPLVPDVSTGSDRDPPASDPTVSDGGRRSAARPFDRPPRTDYASEYTRDAEEIEPFVADLR